MKRCFICIVMVMLCHAVILGIKPALNLSKTWGWPPLSYYDAPYRSEGGSFWSQLQQAGILDPLDEGRELQIYFSYGYYGYDSAWGYNFFKQSKLEDPIYYLPVPENKVPLPPGVAPIKPSDPQEDMSWGSTIDTFLKNLNPAEWSIIHTNTLKKIIPDLDK